ncbi:iron-containing alcohol dehydrogenase [Trichlorobacter lovleyi]|uniref:alcohol dehydrogenase-like regulatory protein ErcA n=1 Tax=Trichlorobacter lovleyi TaxID=313985 RepID=UPI00223F37B4|nr:alcohol dehydrogenase-like regulatory protein ErcA [Trichlorobacter lovleyi]QOX78116.1 iron-containing alcohol dehydrogenase [Trichlorobacter lovleyi]
MEPFKALRKFVIPEIVYGADAHTLVGYYAKGFALQTVLVVSDPGVEQVGWCGRVIARLSEAGICAVPFTRVTSNPKDHEVMAGATVYRDRRCDGIVAVGGGSPMDCAKGIGIVCSNGGHILDYTGVDQVPLPMPPLICIPTTAGSAADISQFAIITDTGEQRKVAIVSKSLVPDVSLIDPLLTSTMSADLTACTGMDALVHAIEAYVSNASSPFTDLHALEAIRLIGRHLPEAIDRPLSTPARDAMMFASTQAGIAFSNASLGAVHAMAHSLGGALDIPHGACNARLLEHVITYNFPAAVERYRAVAHALGIELHGMHDTQACTALVRGIADFRQRLGITGPLAGQGGTRSQLSDLAAKAMQDACMVTNPRRPTLQDIEAIYAAAF